MAKLPSPLDIKSREYRPSSPSIKFTAPDYSPIAKGAVAIQEGMAAVAKAQDEVDDFDTRRRLIDFKLESEMALEEAKREMPAGGAGFTDAWQKNFRKRAQKFVGPEDAHVPEKLRGSVGLLIKQHEAALGERAQRYELAERDREHVSLLGTQLAKISDAVGGSPARREELESEAHRLIDASRIPGPDRDRIKRNLGKDLDKVQATGRILSLKSQEQYDAFIRDLRLEQEDEAPKRGKSAARIGSVSERYESAGRGVGFISSGRDDPGGPSYGVHQLSTKDSMPAFLRSPEGKAYAARFAGLQPGTSEFNRVYRAVAQEDAAGLADAQLSFLRRTHYEPLLEHARAKGFDVNDRGVQEALFSMSVQHGGARRIVDMASAGGNPTDQIRSLYENRGRYVAGLSDLPMNTKQSVLNRYRNEVHDAMSLSGTRAPDPETVSFQGEMDAPPADPAAAMGKRLYANLSLMERRTIAGDAARTWLDRLKDIRAEQARQRVNEWISGTVEFNPMSRDGRKLLDETIAESDIGKRIESGDFAAVTQAAELTKQLRHAPGVIAESVAGLVRSTDPAKKALGFSTIYNITHFAPNALDHMPGHEQLVRDAQKFRIYQDRYGGTTAALKRMAEDSDPEKQRARKASKEEADKFAKDSITSDTVRGALARGFIGSKSWGEWWSNPELPQDYQQQQLMLAEMKELARREFEITGDKDQAIANAQSFFRIRHGVSDVMGTARIMEYPPDRFWPPVNGSYEYMKKDIETVVGTYGASADPKSIRLQFAGWGRDGKPTYAILWRRKDNGLIEGSPRPWAPGLTDARVADETEWKAKRDEAMKDVWDEVPSTKPSEAIPTDDEEPAAPNLLTREGRMQAMDRALDALPTGESAKSAIDTHLKDVKTKFDRARSSTQLKPKPLGTSRRGRTSETTVP